MVALDVVVLKVGLDYLTLPVARPKGLGQGSLARAHQPEENSTGVANAHMEEPHVLHLRTLTECICLCKVVFQHIKLY